MMERVQYYDFDQVSSNDSQHLCSNLELASILVIFIVSRSSFDYLRLKANVPERGLFQGHKVTGC